MDDIERYQQAYQEFNDAYAIYAETCIAYRASKGVDNPEMHAMLAARRLRDQCSINLDAAEAKLQGRGELYISLP